MKNKNYKSNNLKEKTEEAVDTIRKHSEIKPEAGIILGTGLGALAHEIENAVTIPYEEIPHFPVSTVEFHKGKLILGKLSGKDVVAMQGRFHYYEGYSMLEITFPVRVMKYLGIKTLVISNACGSLNPNFRAKDIMIIDDHINLLGGNPLIGVNDESMGPRFVDMSEPYSQRLSGICERSALELGIQIRKGVYAAMSGPSLETRAEYRLLRTVGADVVGMSTVPETIVARQMGIEVLGLSIITDECYPDALKPVKIEEILANAAEAEPNLTKLVKHVLAKVI
jgi:purine-nucleoside phosphorylase